jgi:hypothetical protein
MAHPSLALAFTTIDRPQVAQRLIRSVRKYFGDLPIYVADQSRHIDAMSTFYAVNNVDLTRMPYDIGVTASRNLLASKIKEDYFVLCDDDFVFGTRTDFREAMRILETVPEIGIVGGRLIDFDDGEEYIRNWELFLEYDTEQKILFSIPIYDLAPKTREIAGIRFYLCDAVLNFAVFRRSMFSAGVKWDERFKSNGEHEDFYLNLKINTCFRVVHLPTMIAYHHHPKEYSAYRSRLRDRNDGWKFFLEKWGLGQHLEVGLGVRTIDDVTTVTSPADARSRFFVNGNLSLRRSEPKLDALLIENFKHISTVGALDEWGECEGRSAAIGSLLLDRKTGRLAVPSAENNLNLAASGGDKENGFTDRYELQTIDDNCTVSFANDEIYFRYDAILRADTDFFVWYRCKGSQLSPHHGAHQLAVVVRWSACDGAPLAWRSKRIPLDTRSFGYWRPLLLDVPLLPRGGRWLRFDIITDGGSGSHPVCTGFLFASSLPPGRAVDHPGFEVVALNRIPDDLPVVNDKYLGEGERSCPSLPVTLHSCPMAADMSVLRIDEIADIETLFFVGWSMLGAPLVGARLPAPTARAPSALALPGGGSFPAGGRVYGYGSNTGVVALSLAQSTTPVAR